MVELHVTSLDVIHSFWAYQLGVKADANPNVDNVVFVKPKKAETFEVRCSELCGIWHGEMFDHGHVVSRAAFATWIAEQQKKYAAATKVLPPYSKTYLPEPTRRAE
jgi:cytochrome c oxidase subunit 2